MQPVDRLAPAPWMLAAESTAVMAALTAGGAPVRYVGGAVRDTVLGRPVPADGDIDLATPEPPECVMERLTAAGLKALPSGLEHGTVTDVSGRRHFEITTLRRDVESDGRHAQVAFEGDWLTDAGRRDFTMNALYLDADGTLYDPCQGRADLEAGRVRFVGQAEQRIKEDYLRILRFFRFYAHFGRPPIDAAALAACRQARAGLSRLSAERVAAELLKLLAARDPGPALNVMADCDILAEIVPEARRLRRLAGLVGLDGDDPDPLRRLGALLAVDGAGAQSLARRLKLSRAQGERLRALAEATLETDLDPAGARRAVYGLGAEGFADAAYLRWAERPEDGRWAAHLALANDWTVPVLPVDGDDVLALGISPGPQVGCLLAAAEDWWLDGDFQAGREACLEKLVQLAAAKGKAGV